MEYRVEVDVGREADRVSDSILLVGVPKVLFFLLDAFCIFTGFVFIKPSAMSFAKVSLRRTFCVGIAP